MSEEIVDGTEEALRRNKAFIAACGAFANGRADVDLPAAERLYLLGADVNYSDADGWSALFHACGEGHLKVVEWLIEECDASIDMQAPDGCTPMWIACFNGRRNVVQYLLRLGANEQIKASPVGEPTQGPAMAARRNRHPGIADLVDTETALRREDPSRVGRERNREISVEKFREDLARKIPLVAHVEG